MFFYRYRGFPKRIRQPGPSVGTHVGMSGSQLLDLHTCCVHCSLQASESRVPQPAPINYDLLADFVLGLVDRTYQASFKG